MLPEDSPTPKGLVVIAAGYLEGDKEKLVKAVKKPQDGDAVCTGYDIPGSFVQTMPAFSKQCPAVSFGNNATAIMDAERYSKSIITDVIQPLIRAFRMYKVSGNYEEFEVRAEVAIKNTYAKAMYITNEQIRSDLVTAAEALKDAMSVKNARRGRYGMVLNGEELLRLNDKYGLRDVSESLLDDEIITVGIRCLNEAGDLAGLPKR